MIYLYTHTQYSTVHVVVSDHTHHYTRDLLRKIIQPLYIQMSEKCFTIV